MFRLELTQLINISTEHTYILCLRLKQDISNLEIQLRHEKKKEIVTQFGYILL